jgi:SAM-dependent methyltransferase
MEKPFSEACERNKGPILSVFEEVISPVNKRLLEVGAGTGQHALHIAPRFPHVEWVPSDRYSQLPVLKAGLAGVQIKNLKEPIPFDVGKDDFPGPLGFDLVFTANTFHIMHWKECKSLMKQLGHRLREGSQVLIYGPFNYNGRYTSESNEQFDRMLKARDPLSGIRSFEDVLGNMIKNGFTLCKDFEMPANNRLLVFNRLAFVRKK